MMNDIDELKREWKEIDIPAPDAPIGNGQNSHAVPRSIKDRLLRLQKRMLLISACGIICVPGCLNMLQTPTWLAICFCIYFLLAIVINIYQIKMLDKADMATLTTVEAIEFVERYAVTRSRCKALLICLAVPLLIGLLLVLDHESEPGMIYGFIAGAVTGGAIGFIINRKFKKNIALLRRYLGTEE